jgi:hypothetical protein
MFQHSILFKTELYSFNLTVWHKRKLWNVFLLCGLAPSLLPPQERGWQCAWVRLGKNHDTINLRGGFLFCTLICDEISQGERKKSGDGNSYIFVRRNNSFVWRNMSGGGCSNSFDRDFKSFVREEMSHAT